MAPIPEGWLYCDPGSLAPEPKGYFSTAQLKLEAELGRLTEDCTVWHAVHTKGDWIPASRFPELKKRFAGGQAYLTQQTIAAAVVSARGITQHQAEQKAVDEARQARLRSDQAAAMRLLSERQAEFTHIASTEPPAPPPPLLQKLTKFLFPPPPYRPAWEAVREVAWRTWPVLALFFAVVFASFADNPFLFRGWFQWLGYPAILLTGGAAIALFLHPFRRPWLTCLGWAGVLAWLLYYGYYDTYDRHWETNDTSYRDTYGQWSGRHLWRDVDMRFGGENLRSEAGPISFESGKPHGKWRVTIWKPEIRFETVFYWHGEEVSEGEWRRRN